MSAEGDIIQYARRSHAGSRRAAAPRQRRHYSLCRARSSAARALLLIALLYVYCCAFPSLPVAHRSSYVYTSSAHFTTPTHPMPVSRASSRLISSSLRRLEGHQQQASQMSSKATHMPCARHQATRRRRHEEERRRREENGRRVNKTTLFCAIHVPHSAQRQNNPFHGRRQ